MHNRWLLKQEYLRTPKFYLQTRIIDFGDGDGDNDDFENWQYEQSSSSEFADTFFKENMSPTETSRKVLQTMPRALDTEKSTDSGQSKIHKIRNWPKFSFCRNSTCG